eukprot:12168753-Prorocentrum_lima.AAC.1
MEVASPRASHRRSLPGRERAGRISSSSKSSLQRARGGAPAGELLDLHHARLLPRGRRGKGEGDMQEEH